MKKFSVVLAVFNEEKNIRECLESVKWADEIIVVDGTSTDKTVEIVKEFTPHVFETDNKQLFHINKNMAIEKATGDWVLQLDADERVTKELKDEMFQVIESDPPYAAFYLPRKNFFLGRFLKKGGQYPDYVIRLFRCGKAHLPAKHVHEQMVVDGLVGRLSHELIHMADPTFERYLMRSDRYTSLEATLMLEKGVKPSFFFAVSSLFIKPVSTFFSLYLRHKGFQDGFPGLVFAMYSGIHYATSYIKFWEKYNETHRH
ncbi:MAG TPA: glycosyltransferase family 2 protein [Patescibacteria group bacterium]|nr:glycosyltransferase family 2 protein [Patescibacteria group bacterium]